MQTREYFLRRRDKLRERRVYYSGEIISTTLEYFNPGAAYGIKELRVVYVTDASGVNEINRRVYKYYWSARMDGNVLKDEQIGIKTVEQFEGREDKLYYRSATYGAPKSAASPSVRPPPLHVQRLAAGDPPGCLRQASVPSILLARSLSLASDLGAGCNSMGLHAKPWSSATGESACNCWGAEGSA